MLNILLESLTIFDLYIKYKNYVIESVRINF